MLSKGTTETRKNLISRKFPKRQQGNFQKNFHTSKLYRKISEYFVNVKINRKAGGNPDYLRPQPVNRNSDGNPASSI